MAEIIEGRWEDLMGRHDLQGRKIRAVVYELGETGQDDPWVKSLRAWADSHAPLGRWVDDSRDSIYSGTLDDPR